MGPVLMATSRAHRAKRASAGCIPRRIRRGARRNPLPRMALRPNRFISTGCVNVFGIPGGSRSVAVAARNRSHWSYRARLRGRSVSQRGVPETV
jgi:hypothetical protein